MLQLFFHWLGDYILQSDYMAVNKSKRSWPCLVHCTLYTVPFLFLTQVPLALFWIFSTHFVLDRFSLAKYLIWAKNHLAPWGRYHPFNTCKITGYHDAPLNGGFGGIAEATCGVRPLFLTMWLYIITDNGLHLTCNYVILNYFK